MDYKKELLQMELDSLIGESINNIYYYTEYEGYKTFKQLANEIVEVPLLGILLETSSNGFYNIINFDYSPYHDLGGILVFKDDSLCTPQGRPNQIKEPFWKRFRNKKITQTLIIENFYRKTDEQIVVPFGIKLLFEEREMCYIMNLSIEGFIEDKNQYDICRGGGLVVFSNENSFSKYETLKEKMFYI